MAKHKRGQWSRRNYKRRRRAQQRASLAAAQQSPVIVSTPYAPPSDVIVDHAPSMKDKVIEPTEIPTPGAEPAPTPPPAVVTAPVILSPCDQRLIEVLSDPAKFAEFKAKVASSSKLIVVQ